MDSVESTHPEALLWDVRVEDVYVGTMKVVKAGPDYILCGFSVVEDFEYAQLQVRENYYILNL